MLIGKSYARFGDLLYRSSHQRYSVRKGVLRNFARFTGKHLCQSLFFNKAAGLRLYHRCFPVNFEKFLRTSFLQNTSWRLLLDIKAARNVIKANSNISSQFYKLSFHCNWKFVLHKDLVYSILQLKELLISLSCRRYDVYYHTLHFVYDAILTKF